MHQNERIEAYPRHYGQRFGYEETKRRRGAPLPKTKATMAKTFIGLPARRNVCVRISVNSPCDSGMWGGIPDINVYQCTWESPQF